MVNSQLWGTTLWGNPQLACLYSFAQPPGTSVEVKGHDSVRHVVDQKENWVWCLGTKCSHLNHLKWAYGYTTNDDLPCTQGELVLSFQLLGPAVIGGDRWPYRFVNLHDII